MILYTIIERIVLPALFADSRLASTDLKVYLWLRFFGFGTMHSNAIASRIPRETFRRSALRLLETEWVYKIESPSGGRSRYFAWMPPDVEQAAANELLRVRNDVAHVGEWLMKCVLDIMVMDLDYHDNARPAWLVSGGGSGRMELDRWYRSAGVAFEFQGSHHFRVGGPHAPTAVELSEQIVRDNVKAGICSRENVHLVEITAQDLSYSSMLSKIDGLLPLRVVREQGVLARTLANQCQNYANYVARELRRT